ncbi:hypothetical protein H4582DRAFT_2074662 [Lactarius indigo]|nr:hypothetical protein H4582DRAFT_2074662 [Lactarius indigo]
MPSTRPTSIPLDAFPFLGPRTRNDDILTDQPPFVRSPLGTHHDPHDDHDAPPLSAHGGPNIGPPWRLYLYNLLERPNSSPAAVLVHVLITVLIVFSALVTILETVPAFHSLPGGIWFGIETSLVALFTVEYIARCAATSFSWSAFFGWAGSFLGITDLLAILPYYIEIALQKDTSTLFRFSILRTFRLVRVFRPFRYNNTLLLTIEVMYLSFRRSQDALLALGFFVLMVVVVFSTLIYFIERGTWDDTLETFINSDGDPSQFASIPAAAWFVIVTISTVGYGEMTPSLVPRALNHPPPAPLWAPAYRAALLRPRTRFTQSPGLLSRLRSRQHASEEHLHAASAAESSAIDPTCEHHDQSYHQLVQSQTALESQLAELRAAMDTQSTLLRRIMERDGREGELTLVGSRVARSIIALISFLR